MRFNGLLSQKAGYTDKNPTDSLIVKVLQKTITAVFFLKFLGQLMLPEGRHMRPTRPEIRTSEQLCPIIRAALWV